MTKSFEWFVREHISANSCINVPSGEFKVEKFLVHLTLTMLEEKKKAENELMKTVRDFQIEREKELEMLFTKENEEIDLDTNNEVYNEERFNSIDSKLARLESTLAMISQKLDRLTNN